MRAVEGVKSSLDFCFLTPFPPPINHNNEPDDDDDDDDNGDDVESFSFLFF